MWVTRRTFCFGRCWVGFGGALSSLDTPAGPNGHRRVSIVILMPCHQLVMDARSCLRLRMSLSAHCSAVWVHQSRAKRKATKKNNDRPCASFWAHVDWQRKKPFRPRLSRLLSLSRHLAFKVKHTMGRTCITTKRSRQKTATAGACCGSPVTQKICGTATLASRTLQPAASLSLCTSPTQVRLALPVVLFSAGSVGAGTGAQTGFALARPGSGHIYGLLLFDTIACAVRVNVLFVPAGSMVEFLVGTSQTGTTVGTVQVVELNVPFVVCQPGTILFRLCTTSASCPNQAITAGSQLTLTQTTCQKQACTTCCAGQR